MKKYIAILFCIFAFTACDSIVTKTQSAVTPMTQPIVQETPIAGAAVTSDPTAQTTTQADAAAQTTTQADAAAQQFVPITQTAPATTQSAPATTQSAPTTTQSAPAIQSTPMTTGITEETVTAYYQNVAEEKAVEADIEKLETDFRMGRVQQDTFRTQKAALKQQENMLEAQIDPLDNIIPSYTPPQGWVDTTNIQAMIQKLQEVKIASDQFEFSLDQAEYSYISGGITRDSYKQQVIELEKQKDILDRQEDILENILESYGYDD